MGSIKKRALEESKADDAPTASSSSTGPDTAGPRVHGRGGGGGGSARQRAIREQIGEVEPPGEKKRRHAKTRALEERLSRFCQIKVTMMRKQWEEENARRGEGNKGV